MFHVKLYVAEILKTSQRKTFLVLRKISWVLKIIKLYFLIWGRQKIKSFFIIFEVLTNLFHVKPTGIISFLENRQ